MDFEIQKIAVIGGDKRQLYLARSLQEEGYLVYLSGFDSLKEFSNCCLCTVEEALGIADIVILPVPCLRADGALNAPYAVQTILFSEKEIKLMARKPVFTAFSGKLIKRYPQLKGARIYDYAVRDDFAVRNAVPTAEGALEIAMNSFEGTISGSRVLVTGYGRVGKALVSLLTAVGAQVTAAARKSSDRAAIESVGAESTDFDNLGSGYDLVFNTVPAMIFDESRLSQLNRDALLFDLASLPGGVDFDASEKLGIDARRALALPGKCAPKTAGEIIKTTVFEIIKEVSK
jgi:dipicolinate synthase subunit A